MPPFIPGGVGQILSYAQKITKKEQPVAQAFLKDHTNQPNRTDQNAFHVVIVGGGPAGSSAAFTLASHGIRVCVIDQAAFPRAKLCGGLLTLRCQKVFNQVFQQSWAPTIQTVATGASFFYRNTRLASVRNYTKLYFTARTDFDAFLLELARQRGAVFWPQARPALLEADRGVIHLRDGRTLSFQFLIGADGVHSFVARSLLGQSFRKKTIGFGLEIEVPCSADTPPLMDPEIYFGLVNWGYAWVFPKRQGLTVGVGGRLRDNPNLKAILQRFLIQRFGGIPRSRVEGHHVPFGDFLKKPGRDNILLCGDAAGLVEPITGEGIAFALRSGYDAAQAIIKATAQKSPLTAMDCYLENYELILEEFRRAKLLRQLIFPPWAQPLVARFLPRSSSLPRRHLDLLAGDLSYADYSRYIMSKIWKAPWQLLLRRR